MERQTVVSSNLDSVGYDPETRELEVEFKGGRVYRYSDVPQNTFDELMNASSHGSYFYNNIRDSFSFDRVG